jgi:uncharacterized protein (AIM24 family)
MKSRKSGVVAFTDIVNVTINANIGRRQMFAGAGFVMEFLGEQTFRGFG